MIVTIPIRIESVSNLRECWQARARRAREHVQATYYALRAARVGYAVPCVVTLTRIAPRTLDSHDNLRMGLKASVDGVALWLAVDDAHPGIEWRYAQRKGAPKQYALEVEITEVVPA